MFVEQSIAEIQENELEPITTANDDLNSDLPSVLAESSQIKMTGFNAKDISKETPTYADLQPISARDAEKFRL